MIGVRDILATILPKRRRVIIPEQPTSVRGGEDCSHVPEVRVKAGTLAHPYGFLCRDCGKYIAPGLEQIMTKEG